MKKFLIKSLKDNQKIIKNIILPNLFKKRIFILTGSLGSGKTTFIKEIAKFLKIKDQLTSPTFVLWQKYKFRFKKRYCYFNHLDLYRIKAQDILKINLKKEIDNKNNLFFIEWGEKLVPWFKKKKKDFCQIIIQKNGRQRIFSIK